MQTLDNAVVSACKHNFQAHKSDCSGFVKAVAQELKISPQLFGQANDIVDQIQRIPWLRCADGRDAARRAAEGNFVVGGLKAQGHGHVVVVTPGPLSQGKYPTAYWGTLGGIGKENTSVSYAWRRPIFSGKHATGPIPDDLDAVIYAYRTVTSMPLYPSPRPGPPGS